MALNQLKEEKISDDEGDVAQYEERLFLDAPIEVEYPVKVEPKEEPHSESSHSDSQYILPDNGYKDHKEESEQCPNYNTEPNGYGSTPGPFEYLVSSGPFLEEGVFGPAGNLTSSTDAGDASDPIKHPVSQSQTGDGCGLDDRKGTPLQCEKCHKGFRHKSSLFFHEKRQHTEKTFACDMCTQKFSFKSSLVRHRRVHTGEKPFECEHCQQKFTTNRGLLIHVRLHTGEKPFKCGHGQCGRTFTEPSGLAIHQRTHTGEKPFECGECHARFADRSSQRRHLRIHIGDRPFECIQCKKKFSQKWDLQTHLRKHTGEKPFQCELCEKRFSDRANWTKHVRSHGGKIGCV